MNGKWTRFPLIVAAVWLVGLVVLAATDQTADADDAATAEPGTTLAGVIKFDGPVPQRTPIDMTPTKGGAKDECSALHKTPQLSETAIVSADGHVANVFVYVKKGLEKGKIYPMPSEPAVLNQSGCMYQPRVQGVRVGQSLVIRNSDKLTHNTRSYAFRNRAFNIAQPADSEEREKVFSKPEKAIQMGCDIHSWMKAFVFAMDNPFFAVSDQQGEFKIEGLPEGEYTITAWHEEFGEQDASVTIGPSGSANVEITFKNKQGS